MKNLLLLILLCSLLSCEKNELFSPDPLQEDVALTATALKCTFPDVLPLPTGFQPEGIVLGYRNDFYVGSLVSGAIYKGNILTGEGEVFITPSIPLQAVGLAFDKRSGYLYVSGGLTGTAAIYDTKTKAPVQIFTIGPPEVTFVNDVVVTRDGAYFTDSFSPVLYKIPLKKNGRPVDLDSVVALPMSGFSMEPPPNPLFPFPIFANGIDATPSGHSLIVANLYRGELYLVDPDTGDASLIDLNGASVPLADGILLDGKYLYVVQNLWNQIAVIRMDYHYKSGRLIDTITDENFGIPATIDDKGNYLYAVNAHFDLAPPGVLAPDVEFEVVKVQKIKVKKKRRRH